MRLLKLELKRILKTRLTIILLLSALFLSFLMAWLPTTFCHITYLDENGALHSLSGLDALRYEKQVQAFLSGDVTPGKVRKAVETAQRCLKEYGVEETYLLPPGVYGRDILPYAPLLRGAKQAFTDPVTGQVPTLLELDPKRVEDYYHACEERLLNQMAGNSDAEQEAAEKLYSTVEKPFQFFPGYNTDPVDYQVILAMLILLMCAVIAAPIFTSDYQTGADDILRCTRHGQLRFALVKIASALLISSVTFCLSAVIYIAVSNSLFGWESTKTSMQLLYSAVNLGNMNIRQLQVFSAVGGGLSVLATVSVTLYLSSRCENTVAALGGALGLCILPTLLYAALPAWLGDWICGILPASGAGLQTSVLYATTDFTFLGGIWLPYFMVAVYLIEIPCFTILSVRAYVRHGRN